MMLIKSGSSLEMVKISWSVIIAATTMTALFFLFVVGLGLKAQRSKVVTGIEGLIGDTGEVIDMLAPTGTCKNSGRNMECGIAFRYDQQRRKSTDKRNEEFGVIFRTHSYQ